MLFAPSTDTLLDTYDHTAHHCVNDSRYRGHSANKAASNLRR